VSVALGTRWLLILSVFGAAATLGTAPDPKADVDRSRVLLERWSRSNLALIDPAQADRLGASLYNFREVYCYEGNEEHVRTNCKRLLADGESVYDVVRQYLDTAAFGRAEVIPSFYELLARRIGSTAAASGWSPNEVRIQRTLELQAKYRGLDVKVVTDRGLITASHRVERVCMPAGEYVLVAGGFRYRLKLPKEGAAQLERIGGVQDPLPPAVAIGVPWYATCLTEQNVTVDGRVVHGPGRDTVMTRQGAAVSATELHLAIKVPASVCPEACQRALRTGVLDAIAFWRAACSRCAPTHLAVVKVDGDAYVDEQIAFPMGAGGGVSYVMFGRRALTRFVHAPAPARLGTMPGRRDGGGGPSPAAQADDVITMSLVVGKDSGSCGGGKEVIACAVAGKSVELNSADYTFTVEETRVLGDGPARVSLLLVLIHEVGHWFGMPHVDDLRTPRDDRHAIMETGYVGAGQCITTGELKLLDEVTDLDSPRRLKACSGFHFQPADQR
jgi:hypothetical protein